MTSKEIREQYRSDLRDLQIEQDEEKRTADSAFDEETAQISREVEAKWTDLRRRKLLAYFRIRDSFKSKREELKYQMERQIADGESSTDRVISHNKAVKASAVLEKLRIQYNMKGTTPDELIVEIKSRLDKMSVEYQNYGADPVEHRRLDKREKEYRSAIVVLGGSLEDVRSINWRYSESLRLASPDDANDGTKPKLASQNQTDDEIEALLNNQHQKDI